MANSLCFSPVISFKSPHKPGVVVVGSSAAGKVFKFNNVFQHHGNSKFQSLEVKRSRAGWKIKYLELGRDAFVKATDSNQSTKPNSIVCSNCDGNGAVQCSQCCGSGVNSVDHFNGQFKAGALCWLCRGRREILCGDCNGAGFIGGFMSTVDD